MKKQFVGLIIVLLVVLALIFYFGKSGFNSTTGTTGIDNSDNSPNVVGDDNNLDLVKTFIVTGENFKFVMDGVDNPQIRVQKGDTVRIEFLSTSGFHDFVIDELNAATSKVNSGESTSVEFVASQEGSFEYYCSVGQHRANGMKGMFVVE